jgi:hypothetical protein
MRSWQHAILAAALAACAVGVMLLFSLTSAAAAPAAAVTYTQTFLDVTESFPFANPCKGAPGTATITFSGVMHVTFLTSGQGTGTFWATGTETGDGLLTPTEAALPSYSGHVTSRFANNNLHNGAETTILTIHATGSDG